MTQRQMTFKDVCGWIMLEKTSSDTYVGGVLLSWYDVTIAYLHNVCDSAVFCALHDQLASLDIHAQLTRCFSAVGVGDILMNWQNSSQLL